MRQTCLSQVHELARRDARVVFIGSDLGAGTLDAFRAVFGQEVRLLLMRENGVTVGKSFEERLRDRAANETIDKRTA